MYVHWQTAAFSSLLALCFISGCGDNLHEVKGIVKFDGKLVDSGSIRFVAVDNSSPAVGAIITNGQYSTKVPIGEMKVSVTATRVVGKKALYDKPDGPFMDVRVNVSPEKYSDDKSILRYTVIRGTNQKDWELTSN